MTITKELILFVPGFGGKEPEKYLKKLIDGISIYCKEQGLHCENKSVEDLGKGQIEITLSDNCTKVIDIDEAYWADLCPLLSSESGIIQVIRGLELFIYWIMSKKLWKQVWSSRYIFVTFIITLVVALGWYYGVLAAMFTAMGANPEVFGVALPSSIAKNLSVVGQNMGSWYVWVIASVILSFLPVKIVIDISYGAKCYLKDHQRMYQKIYTRITQDIKRASHTQPYNRITVLSHSFGVVISTEVLANYNGSAIRHMTLGGSLLITAARCQRVNDALQKVLINPMITSWTDFYSDNDWLCTKSPISQNNKNFLPIPITSTVYFDERLTGVSHDLYFNDNQVIKTLLE